MDERLKKRFSNEVFDQSAETQKRRFEELLGNHRQVDEAVGWFNQNVRLAADLGVDWSDLGGHIIGKDFAFPGNITRFMVNQDLGDDLAKKIVEVINNKPHLILKAPHLVSPRARRALKKMNPEIEEVLVKNFGPGKSEEEERLEFEERYGEKLADFAQTIDLTGLSTETLAEIASFMYRSKELLLGSLYHYHVLDEAAMMLVSLIPDQSTEIERVRQNCLLAQSGLSDIDGQTEFAYIGIGPFHGVRVQKDIYTDDFDSSHGYRVLATAHELSHAFVAGQIFQIKPYTPGIEKRMKGGKLMVEEERRLEREVAVNMERVILEAVGIWVEEEMAEKMRAKSGSSSTLHRMNKFMGERRWKIGESRSLLDKRARLLAGFGESIASAKPLAYYEGMILVDRWREVGVEIADIGEKLKKFVFKAKEVIGEDMTELVAVPFDYSLESKYQRLMKLLI